MVAKTRKNVPWSGWSKESPNAKQRTTMRKRCGKKCFLGTKKSFPICKKNTCKVSKKGVYAAYIRGRQYSSKGRKYKKVARKADKMLKKMGVKK
jgi:hypothetical protein|tara:strand:+ start:502 stop:783 length:282 start_codon:yes stop_codon:yes gene_type:complete